MAFSNSKATMALAALTILMLVIIAYLNWPMANQSLLQPGDTQIVAKGEQVYTENCASCHGDNLQGEPDWKTRKPDGLGFPTVEGQEDTGKYWIKFPGMTELFLIVDIPPGGGPIG